MPRDYLRRLGAFLFPAACLGCQATGDRYLCTACGSQLVPSRSLVAGAEMVTLGAYDGVLKACLTAVKQQGHKALGLELAQLAARRVERQWGGLTAIVTYSIRPSRSGQRYRGFSLPAMIENEVRARTGWSALDPALAARFPDSDTSSRGLNLEQRLERQQRLAFEEHRQDGGLGDLLLLDDVVTTGATLAAAVGKAHEMGFRKVRCFALAVAPDG